MPIPRPTPTVAAALVIACLSLANNLGATSRTGFNPDESRWIHRAHLLLDIRHPRGPTWEDGYETRGQPPLGSLATGLGLLLQGRDLSTNGPWNYAYQGTRGWHQNIADGNMPSPADLAAARRTSAVVVAATVVAVFALLLRLTSALGATAGAFVLAVHPFQAYIGSLATADALLGLLLAAAGLAAAGLAARPTWRHALLLGVLLGLGGATKLSPLVVTLPLAALGALWLLAPRIIPRSGTGGEVGRFPRRPASDHVTGLEGMDRNSPDPRRRPHSLATKLLSVPLVAAVTFVAVYPYLWPDPIRRTFNLFAFRSAEMTTQSGDWPDLAVVSRADAFRRVGLNFHDRYSFARVARGFVERTAGLAWHPPAIELCLVLIGVLFFAAEAIRSGPSPPLLVFVLLAAQVGITLAAMRSEFDRYHVPMALAAAVAVGFFVDRMARIGSGSGRDFAGLRRPALWLDRATNRKPDKRSIPSMTRGGLTDSTSADWSAPNTAPVAVEALVRSPPRSPRHRSTDD